MFIVEFIGGRKNKDSLYTKLLSKSEATAAQIYDKLRFRVVTRSPDEIFSVLRLLQREVFPFNYVIPEQSTNTLLPFEHHCASRPDLAPMVARMQSFEEEPAAMERESLVDNEFTASSYRVVHFVADMPIRLSDARLAAAPPAASRAPRPERLGSLGEAVQLTAVFALMVVSAVALAIGMVEGSTSVWIGGHVARLASLLARPTDLTHRQISRPRHRYCGRHDHRHLSPSAVRSRHGQRSRRCRGPRP